MSATLRRVVTTTDDGGRSIVLSDGPPAAALGDEGDAGPRLSVIWQVSTPADSTAAGGDPDPFEPLPAKGVARFLRIVFPAGSGGDGPGLHSTETIDVVYVASGSIHLVLDSGEVPLASGEFLVMQGDVHGWRNSGDEPCVLVAMMLGAPPSR